VTSKVVAILLAFTDGDVLSLTEIARRAELPTSTAHRLVSELAAWGLLERTDDVQYRVGVMLRAIGGTAGAVSSSVSERTRRIMEDVSTALQSDVRLGTLHGTDVVYIEKSAGHQPVSPSSTGPVPAHASAMGKAILAFSPMRVAESVIAHGLCRCTASTITSGDRLRRALAKVRLTRLAISQDELRRGRCAMAVPVFGGSNLVAALEVDVRDLPNDLRLLPPVLNVAARSLSREFVVGPSVGHSSLAASSLHAQPTHIGGFVVPSLNPAHIDPSLRARVGAG
jgi:DNA-binding IclR family transcriptional regulator